MTNERENKSGDAFPITTLVLRKRYLSRFHWLYAPLLFGVSVATFFLRSRLDNIAMESQQKLGFVAGALLVALAAVYYGLSVSKMIANDAAMRTMPFEAGELRKRIVWIATRFLLLPFVLIQIMPLLLNTSPFFTEFPEPLNEVAVGFGRTRVIPNVILLVNLIEIAGLIAAFFFLVNVYLGAAFFVSGVNKFVETYAVIVAGIGVIWLIIGPHALEVTIKDRFILNLAGDADQLAFYIVPALLKVVMYVAFIRLSVMFANWQIRCWQRR